LAQDLNAYHSIDAEAELTSMLSEYISLEIDLEILDMLKSNALTVDYWSASIGEEYNAASNTWSAGNNSLAYQKNTWFQTLGVKLNKVSNKIHQLTLRGGANFIVTSPEVASIFETATAGFAPAPSETFTSSLGIQYVGTVNNRWRLYKDPLFQSNQILMGYKGDSYLDSGYFYCPYVPLTQTPVVLDPESFCPRKGILTRYGKKLLREGAKFYARMSIANFII